MYTISKGGDKITFGERLRELRQENEETQAQIAKVLNIVARMISHYEKDEHFPRNAESIILFAQHFNVSTDYLFGISNIRNQNELKDFIADYGTLSEANKNELHSFLKYLLTKEKK